MEFTRDVIGESSLNPSLSPEETEQVRNLAGRLALEVMHEIRNPLEALSHLTFLTLEEPENCENVVLYMKMAEEQVTTLNQIVSQTLGLARTSAAPKLSDLGILVEAALRIHQRIFVSKRVELTKDLPPGVVAHVRTGEILQVLSNLIVNALDALPAGGKLRVRLRQRRRSASLLVADDGHGISLEHTMSIFEPFFTTKSETGTGLGLPLTKRIIEQHGGTIQVRSTTRQGTSGTIFRITLPRQMSA